MPQPALKYEKRLRYDSGRVEISRQAFTNPEELALDITASQGGFVEVYVYNGSASPVWYDQFSISSSQAVIIQENHYYPFGMQIAGLELDLGSRNRYLYQGKELQEDHDLNTLDFHARMYDPAIGRTFQMDPHLENYYSLSPYSWAGNNPIFFIDPDGRDLIGADGERVTYERNTETGEIIWSPNVTSDITRVGNAMLYTETGTAMLDAMIESDVQITLELSNETRLNNKGNPVRGVTAYTDYEKDSDGNYEVKAAKVTIYEGSIKQDRENKAGSNYYKALNTDDKAIAATAGHEAHHATDKENSNRSLRQQQDGKLYPQRETKAIEIQKKIAIETFRKDNQKK